MNGNTIKIISSAVFALSLAGCSPTHVHERGDMPHQKVAFIKGLPGWNPLSVIAVDIYRIDGAKVKAKNDYFEVLPGMHEISVRCSREKPEHISLYYRFSIDMKSGHTYRPKLDMTKECYMVYIDENSGAVYQGTEK